MKKTISRLLAIVMCLSLCACKASGDSTADPLPTMETTETPIEPVSTWNIKYTTDEFGDVTEDSVSVVEGLFEGSFSNTATSDGDLTAVVAFEKKDEYNHYMALIDLKEYNSTNATYLSSDTIKFKMKVGDKIIEDIMAGSPPNGSLCLGTAEYSWGGDFLYNALYEGEDVRCIITIGSSEYHFTVTSDNFNSVCNQNGYGLGAADLTMKEAVKILLDDYCSYNEYSGDWIGNNLDKLEQLDSDEIKQFLEGYFLEFSPTSGSYIPGYDDYVFPEWQIWQYSHSTNTKQLSASYDVDSIGMKVLINANENGQNISGYAGARKYKQSQGTPVGIPVENNTIAFVYSDSSQFAYQCYKITDNLFVLSYEDTNGGHSIRLLLRCSGFEEEDIRSAVLSALETELPLILN